MKKILLGSIIILFCVSISGQQTEPPQKPTKQDSLQKNKKLVPRLATITTMDDKKMKGWFYKMDDANIYLVPGGARALQSLNYQKPDLNKSVAVLVEQVNTVSLQKKNAGLKGALVGLGTGVLAGVIIGYASGDDPTYDYTGNNLGELLLAELNNASAMTAGEKAVGNAVLFGLTGSLTGWIIGKVTKKKFFIGGRKENYHNSYGELKKLSIMY